jgi:hypothetical protein
VCLINRLPVTRKQRHHLTISTSRSIAIHRDACRQ